MNYTDSVSKKLSKFTGISLLLFALAGAPQGYAADPQAEFQKVEIQIWGGPAPDSDAVKEIPKIGKEFISPRMTAFLPPVEKRSGAAVLIIPGGGYGKICPIHEGSQIAKWMAQHGIVGCVLEYRRPVFILTNTRVYGPNAPSDDAFRAMRIIRSHAAEWKISTDKVGVIGFSAGGHLAATVGTHYDKGDANAADALGKLSSRPDFMMLIYPVIDMSDPAVMHTGSRWHLMGDKPDQKLADFYSCQKNVTGDTPPCFIVSATDDGEVKCANSILMYQALKANNVPCELHIFESGGHGYAMLPGKIVTKLWPPLLEAWLTTRGGIFPQ